VCRKGLTFSNIGIGIDTPTPNPKSQHDIPMGNGHPARIIYQTGSITKDPHSHILKKVKLPTAGTITLKLTEPSKKANAHEKKKKWN
jgi:hypothetical protein